MTLRRCDKCAEYSKKWCQFWCESKNPGNTCKEWVDDKERIINHIEAEKRRKELLGKETIVL